MRKRITISLEIYKEAEKQRNTEAQKQRSRVMGK